MGNFCVFSPDINRRAYSEKNRLVYSEENANFKEKGERLEIRFDSDSAENQKVTLSDFKKIKILGIGAFGRVILVKQKNSSNFNERHLL